MSSPSFCFGERPAEFSHVGHQKAQRVPSTEVFFQEAGVFSVKRYMGDFVSDLGSRWRSGFQI